MWSCRCELCQGLFRERFGMPMPIEYAPEVRRFLEESMASLLSDACLYGRRLGLANALCVMPTEWGNPGFTDWERAAVIEGLDNFGADPYWGNHDEPDAYVTRYAAEILRVANAHGLDHHLWVQAFEIRKGHEPGDRRRDRRGRTGRHQEHRRLVVRRVRGNVDVRVRRPAGRVGGSAAGFRRVRALA